METIAGQNNQFGVVNVLDSDFKYKNQKNLEESKLPFLIEDLSLEKEKTKDSKGVKKESKSVPIARTHLYTLEDVANHDSPDSCWIILWDRVYDVTEFTREHPGGEDIIYEHQGRDATMAFCDVNHSKDAHLMLNRYCIGTLIPEQRIFPASI